MKRFFTHTSAAHTRTPWLSIYKKSFFTIISLATFTSKITLANMEALYEACNKPGDDIATVRQHLTTDVNPNTIHHRLKSGIKPSGTALHCAAAQGNLRIARLLIEHQANVNARNEDTETPLHCALLSTEHNQLALAQLLLENKASVTAQDQELETPLHLTVDEELGLHKEADYEKIVHMLLKYKALVDDCPNNNGDTPLDKAKKFNNRTILKMFDDHLAIEASLFDEDDSPAASDSDTEQKDLDTPLLTPAIRESSIVPTPKVNRCSAIHDLLSWAFSRCFKKSHQP